MPGRSWILGICPNTRPRHLPQLIFLTLFLCVMSSCLSSNLFVYILSLHLQHCILSPKDYTPKKAELVLGGGECTCCFCDFICQLQYIAFGLFSVRMVKIIVEYRNIINGFTFIRSQISQMDVYVEDGLYVLFHFTLEY